MAVVGKKNKLDLIRRGRHTHLRLVAKPASRREQHEDDNQADSNVVLPRATLI
jgi:hypothetical protein